jgi:hypothetical protein
MEVDNSFQAASSLNSAHGNMPPPPPLAFVLGNADDNDDNDDSRPFIHQLRDFGRTSHDQSETHQTNPDTQQQPTNDWVGTLLDLHHQQSNLIAQQQANLALQSHLQRQINSCLAIRARINGQDDPQPSGQEFSPSNISGLQGSRQECNKFTIPPPPDCFGLDEKLSNGPTPRPQFASSPPVSDNFHYNDEVQGDNSLLSMLRNHDASIKENVANYKSRKQIPPPDPFQQMEDYGGFQRRCSTANELPMSPGSTVLQPSPKPMEIDNPYISHVENALADDIRRLIETLPRESLQSVIFKTLTDNNLTGTQKGGIRRHILDSFQRMPGYQDLVKDPRVSLQWATLLTADGGQFKTIGSMGTFNLPTECELANY